MNHDQLLDGARAFGVELDAGQVKAFETYLAEMLAWNAKFNLTAITDPAEIIPAIKRGVHPEKWTRQNIAGMKRQLQRLGFSYPWSREIATCDPEYYRWNQWFFLKMLERGIVYRREGKANWCTGCQTVIANEQVVDDNRCERCESPVVEKVIPEWAFRITAFAQELLDGLDDLGDWPERITTMQRNWIGKSVGAEVDFAVPGAAAIKVFTTRVDTIYGCTYVVLAPEHPLVPRITRSERQAEVRAFAERMRTTDAAARTGEGAPKEGVFTGAEAVNPYSGERIPVWVANFVLAEYGTGAIMAVPAHDERDFQFALKFGLPILPVIDRNDRLAKSFALGGTMSIGFAAALRSASIPFVEDRGSLYITIPPEKVDQYIEIARYHVQPDSWNEIVGTRWLFIFHDGVKEWNSLEAEQKIMARCKELEPGVRGTRTVMEMLYGVEFYRDVLFHHEYGTMIHSGEFSGTPADHARATAL